MTQTKTKTRLKKGFFILNNGYMPFQYFFVHGSKTLKILGFTIYKKNTRMSLNYYKIRFKNKEAKVKEARWFLRLI